MNCSDLLRYSQRKKVFALIKSLKKRLLIFLKSMGGSKEIVYKGKPIIDNGKISLIVDLIILLYTFSNFRLRFCI